MADPRGKGASDVGLHTLTRTHDTPSRVCHCECGPPGLHDPRSTHGFLRLQALGTHRGWIYTGRITINKVLGNLTAVESVSQSVTTTALPHSRDGTESSQLMAHTLTLRTRVRVRRVSLDQGKY